MDEVVIFDDGHAPNPSADDTAVEDDWEVYTGYSHPCYFLSHVLAYLETPPTLRKHLFPLHPNLKFAGSLPSLDMPHHLRRGEWCQYREGVTRGSIPHHKKRKIGRTPLGHAYVETGLPMRVFVPASIPPNMRVTVKFNGVEGPEEVPGNEVLADAVAPSAPREEAGYYWGYSVRSAKSLSAVLTECTFDGGYDLTIGTSERGVPVSSLNDASSTSNLVPKFTHLLVVFGGVAGLEVAVKADEGLKKLSVESPDALFDHWVNLCPGQGSRTIRTEEAIWLGLMGLRDLVLSRGKK